MGSEEAAAEAARKAGGRLERCRLISYASLWRAVCDVRQAAVGTWTRLPSDGSACVTGDTALELSDGELATGLARRGVVQRLCTDLHIET